MDSIGLRFDISALGEDPLLQAARLSLPTFSPPSNLRDDVRKVACSGWEDRTRSEYVGVMIVHHFHGLLVDLNAPMDIQEVALTMLRQEQEHAAACMAAARSLGSDGEVAFDVEELRMNRNNRPLEAQLLTMIIGTYAVGEVVAHRLLRHAIRALPENAYQGVLKKIYQDEVLHAHIGSALIRSIRAKEEPRWLPYPGDTVVINEFVGNVEALKKRAVVETQEEELFKDPEAAEQLILVGIPPSGPFREAYHLSLKTDVPKSMEKSGLPITIQKDA